MFCPFYNGMKFASDMVKRCSCREEAVTKLALKWLVWAVLGCGLIANWPSPADAGPVNVDMAGDASANGGFYPEIVLQMRLGTKTLSKITTLDPGYEPIK